MTKTVSIGIFISFVLAFSGNWLLQRNNIHIPIIHSYMDDLIAVPVILFPFLFLYKKWMVNSILPSSYIVATSIILCVIFEIILPAKSNQHISDPIDMALYGLSGVVFYYLQKPFARNVAAAGANQ